MARLNRVGYALWVTWISTLIARSSLRGLPPEWIALALRVTLPVAADWPDVLLASQTGHWHSFVAMAT